MKRPLHNFLLLFLLTLSGLLTIFGAVVWVALEDFPDIQALKDYKPPQSTVVLDRHGELVGRFFDERRTVISLKKLPKHVKYAFIAAEDGDFFEHRGIDYFGLMRAVLLRPPSFFLQVDGLRIHVDAGGVEIFVKRQGLVNPACHYQLGVPVEAAEIRIEVFRVPLEQNAERLLLVVGI